MVYIEFDVDVDVDVDYYCYYYHLSPETILNFLLLNK